MARLQSQSVTEPKKVAQVVHFDLGDYSQEAVTVLADTGIYEVGEVLGIITASGKYSKYDNGAATGIEVAVAVSRERFDSAGADVTGIAIEKRVATLLREGLVFDAGQDQAAQDAAVADLEAAGFKVQTGIGG